MVYDPDPAATHNPATNTVAPASIGDIWNANFAHLGAAWTSFTPAMTFSGGGSLTIGNGSITGAYLKVGKTLKLRIRLSVGSTTSFGTGIFRFTLPDSSTSAASEAIAAWGYDSSADDFYPMAGVIDASATYIYLGSQGVGGVTSAIPVTWANGDALVITGEIEIA